MSLTTAFYSRFSAFIESIADFNDPQFTPHFKLFLDGIYGLEVDLKLNDAVQLVDESGLNVISGRTKNLPYFYKRKTSSECLFYFSKGTGAAEYVCGRI